MDRTSELSKTEEIVLMAIMLADGGWSRLGLSKEEGLGWLSQYVMSLRFDESEDVAKVIRKEIYLHMRNTLMATRRGDLFYLQNHPAFSNWGRSNLTELAQNYARGGKELLHRTITQTFSPGWEQRRPEPSIVGFDENMGVSEATAIRIYNAPSHEDGIEAEYWYLHYKFGIASKNWQLSRQMLLKDQESGRAYDLLVISFPDKTEREVYFDISEFFRD